jgi:uncharacterized membrane protein
MKISLVFLLVFYMASPLLIKWAAKRFTWVDRLGTVLVAYVLGLIIGQTGLIPQNAVIMQEWVMSLSIPLAIPLLLFGSRLSQWKSLARTGLTSMILAMISVLAMVMLGYALFHDTNKELWKIGGMLVGVYTGGTPNLASLKLMLGVDENTYLLTHTYDMILSGFYLLFLLLMGQKLFSFILPAFKGKREGPSTQVPYNHTNQSNSKSMKSSILLIVSSFVIVSISAGAGSLVSESLMMATTMLLITTLGMLGSAISKLRNSPHGFELGMYFILVFSVAVSSMVNIGEMLHASPQLIYYITLVVFGSLILHVGLAYFFKLDAETVMVSSTALICSPPFVPVIAGALNNRALVLPGLSIGIIGYAVGNYLGFLVANFLHWLG